MAAHQHQAQQVVLDEAARVGHDPTSGRGPFRLEHDKWFPAQGHRLGPQPVEHPAARRGEQPGRRVVGGAVRRPAARGRLHGIPQRVLDEVEAAELREEQGDQAAPLIAHRRREHLVGGHAGS